MDCKDLFFYCKLCFVRHQIPYHEAEVDGKPCLVIVNTSENKLYIIVQNMGNLYHFFSTYEDEASVDVSESNLFTLLDLLKLESELTAQEYTRNDITVDQSFISIKDYIIENIMQLYAYTLRWLLVYSTVTLTLRIILGVIQ